MPNIVTLQQCRGLNDADGTNPYLFNHGCVQRRVCSKKCPVGHAGTSGIWKPDHMLYDAQAYITETSFGQELDSKDLVKIMCVRREEAAAAP